MQVEQFAADTTRRMVDDAVDRAVNADYASDFVNNVVGDCVFFRKPQLVLGVIVLGGVSFSLDPKRP